MGCKFCQSWGLKKTQQHTSDQQSSHQIKVNQSLPITMPPKKRFRVDSRASSSQARRKAETSQEQDVRLQAQGSRNAGRNPAALATVPGGSQSILSHLFPLPLPLPLSQLLPLPIPLPIPQLQPLPLPLPFPPPRTIRTRSSTHTVAFGAVQLAPAPDPKTTRDARLEADRIRQSTYRASQSRAATAVRLEDLRTRASTSRAAESPAAAAVRLEAVRTRAATSRASTWQDFKGGAFRYNPAIQ